MRKRLHFFVAFSGVSFLLFIFTFWITPKHGSDILPQQEYIQACYIQSPYTHEQGLSHSIFGGFDYLITENELKELLDAFNSLDFNKALYPHSGSHKILPGRSWLLCFEYDAQIGDMVQIAYTDENFMEIEFYIKTSKFGKTQLFRTQSFTFLNYLLEHYS